jgi:SAM-dependent methyltransferase
MNRYDKKYYEQLSYQTPDNYAEHSRNRADYIYDFIKDYQVYTEKIDLLDIGCGRGGVLHYLEKQIPNLSSSTGYTLDANEHPFHHKLKIIYKNFEDLIINENNGVFNLVIMSHILEHFYNPIEAMKNVWKITKPGSLVYVEVPSFYWAEVRIPLVFCPEHLSYFTENSLKNVFNQSGFTPLKIKHSRIWGNIKVLLRREPMVNNKTKKENWKWILTKHKYAKIFHSYYNKKIKRANPND